MVAKNGLKTIFTMFILKILEAAIQTKIELEPTNKVATAVPINPNFQLITGNNAQVRTAHIIMNLVVNLTFPTALKALVIGEVTEAMATLVA